MRHKFFHNIKNGKLSQNTNAASIQWFFLFIYLCLPFSHLNVTEDTDKSASSSDSGEKLIRLDFSFQYRIKSENAESILLRVNVPKTILDRQIIYLVEYSHEPSRTFSENGNNYVDFIFRSPPEEINLEIRIKGHLYDYDLYVASQMQKGPVHKSFDIEEYLKTERMIEVDEPVIRKAAKGIDGKDQLELVENVYNFVIDYLEQDFSEKRFGTGALQALKTKKGTCLDYSDLFVALCRAKKIPARVVGGYRTAFASNPKHAWAEVFFDDYGWVPFDLIYGENKPLSQRKQAFYDLEPVYISFTTIRNDEALKNLYTHLFLSKGGKVDLEHLVVFRKPVERIYHGLL